MSWQERFPDSVTCVRCLEVKEKRALDRLLWCDSCRAVARRRAATRSWMIGGALTALLALWIWLYIQPSDLVIGGWIATVVAAFWIGSRVCREILYGWERFQNRRAAEAMPPGSPPKDKPPEGPSWPRWR